MEEGNVMSQNVVDGASDVGITCLDPIDSIVEHNTIRNVSMNTSPYNQNTHLGMAVECAGFARNVLYRRNHIENCAGTGIATFGPTADSGKDIVWDGNYITNCGSGLYANRVTGILITNNIVNGTTDATPHSAFGLRINPETAGADIEGNQFMNISPSGTGHFILLLAPKGTFIGNLIHMKEPPIGAVRSPIFKGQMTNWTLADNQIVTDPA